MSFARKLTPMIAIAGLALLAAPAQADTIALDSSKVGQTYTLNYNGFSDGTTVNGLTAATSFTLTGATSTSYTFNYSVTNTTSNPVDSRVSSFAFNTNPDITSASSTGAFSYATIDSSYPNGIGSVDVCFKDASTGACAGGGGSGLTDGQTGTGTFTLNFTQPLTSLTLSDFYVRYQSITGAGNISSANGSGSLSTSGGGTQVPEPGTVGLLAGGLAAAWLLRRRRPVARKTALQPAFA